MQYSILDPTGNITALVETPVAVPEQPRVASSIMKAHPEVEQVGFVTLDPSQPSLRMAGGEFCGNATMCAAALIASRRAVAPQSVTLKVSGAQDAVQVDLAMGGDGSFDGAVHMPKAYDITEQTLAFGGVTDRIPIVCMAGIAHAILVETSPLFDLLTSPSHAEDAVRTWCRELGTKGLGLMFVHGGTLTPLVYIPDANTLFWENSCASGTSAAAMYFARQAGHTLSISFNEPAGTMRVVSDPVTGETVLHGTVRFL